MFNSVVLVGRLASKPTLRVYDGEYMVTTITLAVTRPFKNSQGEFDTDFIHISLWDVIAKNACEYCNIGDVIGVRARIQAKYTEVQFNLENSEVHKKKIPILELIGERVVYIASSNSKQNENKIEE